MANANGVYPRFGIQRNYKPTKDEIVMPVDTIRFYLQQVAGRVLTIIDGAFPEGRQNTALKSMIKKEFRTQHDRLTDYFSKSNSVEIGLSEVDMFGVEHVERLP